VEAATGKIVRHRLSRGVDLQANNALWVITLTNAVNNLLGLIKAKDEVGEDKLRKVVEVQ